MAIYAERLRLERRYGNNLMFPPLPIHINEIMAWVPWGEWPFEEET